MRISAVVPTLNAAERLRECLHALQDADEIVVSDGGSIDDTAAIARSAGARLVEGSRGRGEQLARGAAAASHEALLFVHADTVLGPGAVRSAQDHLTRSDRPACFALRLDDPAWQARWIERSVAARTRLLHLPYGDQGLAVRRDRYLAAGGFRPLPLMEDVDLIRRLGPVTALAAEALTSAERWRREGWLHRSARNLLCLGLWRAGVSPERIARLYHRPHRASQPGPGRVPRAE